MTSFIKGYSARSVAAVLAAAVVLWATGAFLWMDYAVAANVKQFKDVLSDSDVSASSNHTLSFELKNAVAAGETITVTMPAGFTMNSVDFNDMDLSGSTAGEQTLAATASGSTWGAALSGQVITFTSGTGTFAADETVTIEVGTNATAGATGDTQITNHATAGSYVVTLGGTMTDKGKTRIAIVDDVTVTAAVDTSFTFVVAGVASGQTGANGEGTNTSVTSTATTIPWGTLASGTAKVARQDLTVATNAKNGFTVTVWQDQNLTSATGADIDKFRDGTDGAPQAWAAPAGTLDQEDTYGHMGITSADATLSGGDTFGATLYDAIGDQSAPIEIFYHTGPADGSTADKGATEIGYKIEVDELQEAAEDYTSTLTYIATPTF